MLNPGECQRANGTYQYRYLDYLGNRQSIYAPTLNELRDKEKILRRQMDDGLDYSAGKITLKELIDRHIELKQGVRKNTKEGYEHILKNHLDARLFHMQIGSVNVSDIKRWFIQLRNEGYAYSTIAHIKSILNQAFQTAFEEDVIRKNPCSFKLSTVIGGDKKPRFAMTPEQQRQWLDFVKNDKAYAKYYDHYVILLGTGLRISEFCGLTRNDLDFERRRIRIDHQLIQDFGNGYRIEKPKTEKGVRYVPMTDAVYQSLQNVLQALPEFREDVTVDGYGGFIFLTRDGNPESKNSVERRTRRILAKYNEQNDEKLPNITPHVFRHTFCSNMANAGMTAGHLKYIMGHAKISTTLDVYTHADFESAAREMLRLTDGQPR